MMHYINSIQSYKLFDLSFVLRGFVILKLKYLLLQVSMFSPAAKAGVSAGSIINVINDWAIEAMDKPEVNILIPEYSE